MHLTPTQLLFRTMFSKGGTSIKHIRNPGQKTSNFLKHHRSTKLSSLDVRSRMWPHIFVRPHCISVGHPHGAMVPWAPGCTASLLGLLDHSLVCRACRALSPSLSFGWHLVLPLWGVLGTKGNWGGVVFAGSVHRARMCAVRCLRMSERGWPQWVVLVAHSPKSESGQLVSGWQTVPFLICFHVAFLCACREDEHEISVTFHVGHSCYFRTSFNMNCFLSQT